MQTERFEIAELQLAADTEVRPPVYRKKIAQKNKTVLISLSYFARLTRCQSLTDQICRRWRELRQVDADDSRLVFINVRRTAEDR